MVRTRSSVLSAWSCIVPGTLAGGKSVLEVVDGVPGPFAHSTLNPVSHYSSCTHIGNRTQDVLNASSERSGPGAAYGLALRRGVDELLAEDLPVTIVRGVLDDDLLVVVRQLEDDELVLLVELQVIVGSYALLGDGRSAAGRSVSGRGGAPRRGARSGSGGVTDPD